METISCLVWDLFLPSGSGHSYHITLKLHVVSIDCGLKTSDRDDSKMHVSKQTERERARKMENMAVRLYAGIVFCVGMASTA